MKVRRKVLDERENEAKGQRIERDGGRWETSREAGPVGKGPGVKCTFGA